jgi:HSP20 family molecular chaperone IbpA
MSQLTKQEHPAEAAAVERTRECPTYTPRFDICETDDELVLYGDLPGVEPADLDIRFENRELTILGKVAPRHTERRSVYSEYGIGDFYRTFAIGEAIDGERIAAELKNGVLAVHLPKSDAVKPRRIAVMAG